MWFRRSAAAVTGGKRAVVATLVVLAGLVVSWQPPATGVGAFVTQTSVVAGNQFVATEHTSLGAYRLGVDAEAGDVLVPGGLAVAQWSVLQADADPVSHRYAPGDEVVHALTLPAFLIPVVEGAEWDAVQGEDGAWTATHTQRFPSEGVYTYMAEDVLRVPVVVESRPYAATITASTSLPDRFTSRHPQDHAQISALSTAVDFGAYDLKVAPERGDSFAATETGQLSFRTHPGAESETIGFRAGDAVIHTIDLPTGLVADPLPPEESIAGATIVWAAHPETGALTRTTTFTSNVLAVESQEVSLFVIAGLSLQKGRSVTVSTTMPDGVHSRHPVEAVELPVATIDMTNAATGKFHTLALSDDGSAFAWGRNSWGALGTGSLLDSARPMRVDTDQRFTRIAAGAHHSVALTDDGTAYTWGHGAHGALGNGTNDVTSTVPVKVATDLRFTAVTAGYQDTFALTADGRAYAWGRGDVGQLGDGKATSSRSPVEVDAPEPFASLAAGENHVLALTSDGAAYAWGRGASGELGTGAKTDEHVPVRIAPELAFADVSAGIYFSLALTADGVAYAWGSGFDGKLGTGTTASPSQPTLVDTDVRFSQIRAGYKHGVALTPDGRAYAWGNNDSGQLGAPGPAINRPAEISSGELRFTSIATYNSFVVATATDGNAYGWGANGYGQMGNGLSGMDHFEIVAVL